MQILDYMQSCGAQLKMRMLSALITLRRQGELGNTDKLSKGLMGSLRNNTSSNMVCPLLWNLVCCLMFESVFYAIVNLDFKPCLGFGYVVCFSLMRSSEW